MKRYPNRSMLVLVLAAAAIAQARAQSSVQAQTPTQATGDLANPVAALSLDRLSVTREAAPVLSQPPAPASSTCPDCKRSSTTSAAAKPDLIRRGDG